MPDNVPSEPRSCTVPWCECDHHYGPGHHFQPIGDVIPDTTRITVELSYASDQLDGSNPYVDVMYGADWGTLDRLAIPLPAAAALAELLALLPPELLPDFAAALARAAQGPHTPRRTKW